jgi:hypothetical protein
MGPTVILIGDKAVVVGARVGGVMPLCCEFSTEGDDGSLFGGNGSISGGQLLQELIVGIRKAGHEVTIGGSGCG